jgi:hypothetical protein
VASVTALEPDAFAKKFLSWISYSVHREKLRYGPDVVLGSVAEGEVVHVLVRARYAMPMGQASALETLSLTRHAGQWKIALSSQLEKLGVGDHVAARGKPPQVQDIDEDLLNYQMSLTYPKLAKLCAARVPGYEARATAGLTKWLRNHAASIRAGRTSLQASTSEDLEVVSQHVGTEAAIRLASIRDADDFKDECESYLKSLASDPSSQKRNSLPPLKLTPP